jgi:glycosyltransferase involved in cell wall biosynthesis
MATDIVISTYNREALLQRTLSTIAERTTTPHRITVIDDGSRDGTPILLADLRRRGIVAAIVQRTENRGIPAALRDLLSLTQSDPLIYTDDDVLCPKLEPDWLARLSWSMAQRPILGILALNSPQNHVKVKGDRRRIMRREGEVTLCRNVGARFTLIRRRVLEAVRVPDATVSPVKLLCIQAGAAGVEVGYLTATYCQHIGIVSVRNHVNMADELDLVRPVDANTLEPPSVYRD